MSPISADKEDAAGVTSPAIAPCIGAARDAEEKCGNGVKGWSGASSTGTLQPCTRLILLFLMHGAGRRLRHHLPEDLTVPARPDSGMDMRQGPSSQ